LLLQANSAALQWSNQLAVEQEGNLLPFTTSNPFGCFRSKRTRKEHRTSWSKSCIQAANQIIVAPSSDTASNVIQKATALGSLQIENSHRKGASIAIEDLL